MLKEINIRSLKGKDFKKLENFQIKYLDDSNNIWVEDDLHSFQRKDNVLGLVSEIDHKIKGFCLFSGSFDFFELYIIFVQPKFRRKGIAKAFLKRGIEFCKKKKIKEIFLEVNKVNLSAIKLYENFNFKKIGVRENYYLIKGQKFDALKMKLKL